MRLKKMTTLLLAGVMAVGMIAGAGTTAKAEEDPEGSLVSNGTEAKPAELTLTKNLNMDVNLKVHDKTFTFTSTKVSVDGVNTDAVKDTMPALNAVSAAYTATGDTIPTSTNDTIATYKKSTSNLIPATEWPHAGEYVYTIKEDGTDDASYTYSKVQYQVTVYVANGATDGKVFVKEIGVKKIVDENGDELEGTAIVKAAPVFENTYKEKTSLQIKKITEGTYGDKTMEFSYSVTLTAPASGADPAGTTYTAYVYKADGNKKSPTPINFTMGTAKSDIKLANGEFIRFEDASGVPNLPVGTTYTVTETQDVDYTGSVSITKANMVIGGLTANLGKGANVVIDKDKITGGASTLQLGAMKDHMSTTDNENIAQITNTEGTITPTGILINNLPFILMILVAIGGVVAYMALKRRHAVR